MAFYPAFFEHTAEDEVVVSFRDLPECLTSGIDEAEARAEAQDALEEAIVGRIVDGEEIPLPSMLRTGEHYVFVPVIHAGTFASIWRKLDQDIAIVLGSSSYESTLEFTQFTSDAARAQAVSRYTAEALNVLCVTQGAEWNQPTSAPEFCWAVKIDGLDSSCWNNPNELERHQLDHLGRVADFNGWFEKNPNQALTACHHQRPINPSSNPQQDTWFNPEYVQAWDSMEAIRGNRETYTNVISDVSQVIGGRPDYATEWRTCGIAYEIQETFEKLLLGPTPAIELVNPTSTRNWVARSNIVDLSTGSHALSNPLSVRSLVFKQL